MSQMRTIDLFAGCGGLSKGFELAGFTVVAAVENWKPAADCYRANFSHPVIEQDLNDVKSSVGLIEAYRPNIIIGGPPCQDFSHAGKRIEAERASLTEAYAEIVSAVKPAFFVMENVARAQSSRAYATAREILKTAGYGLTERVLTASRCGVPQRRKRFFCVGALAECDGFLDELLDKGLAVQEMTVRDYLGNSLDIEYYYRHPRNYNRRAIYSIDEPAPTMRGVNRPIPKGYPGHPKDACPIGPEVRPLTTLERSLIQTFPADFKWVGSKTAREQMIGNAVPVNLGKYVAEALKIYIDGPLAPITKGQLEAFRTWLANSCGYTARSASSCASRLARSNEIVSISNNSTLTSYLSHLENAPEFASLSSVIQSQLRGAIKKYNSFCRS